MKGILKNRIFLGTGLFALLDFLQGFVIASPILIYLRIIYENTESSKLLWPLPSVSVVTDFILNHDKVLVFFVISAAVMYILFFILKSFFAGGIYRLILIGRQDASAIRSSRDFVRSSSEIWGGILKVGLFGAPVYALALFLGTVFGGFFGRFSGFLQGVIIALIFLLGSTYLQILRIRIAATSNNSLKAALAETREAISKGLLRLFIGNLSVSGAAIIAVLILWIILKALKSSEWSIIVMILTILVQQLMVLVVCLGQSIRINFNYSVIKKGEDNVLGGDELG